MMALILTTEQIPQPKLNHCCSALDFSSGLIAELTILLRCQKQARLCSRFECQDPEKRRDDYFCQTYTQNRNTGMYTVQILKVSVSMWCVFNFGVI